MTVQLALRKNDTRIGARFIQWWTSSIYSHCELVMGGVCCSSSIMDKGVRVKVIDLEPDKWDVIDLPWADSVAVLDYYAKTKSNTYGWFSLIGSQLFNRNQTDSDSQFCSEWCASALGMPNPSTYSPRTLADACRYMGRFGAVPA
ncbi:hypothetical protein PS918_03145 [Pseudomonas fluorescens]|uniref:Uncharacterized protein n=1 Tax=Pseudomonas fluorescens TaxID=294 RepID=A0A5E7SVG9_PSEFL|nr:hypothetical protein [Pseudomonas fluorescens]VVP90054.1 hypothetical protein PS918_03145 [Pseudomonas fluorescens]